MSNYRTTKREEQKHQVILIPPKSPLDQSCCCLEGKQMVSHEEVFLPRSFRPHTIITSRHRKTACKIITFFICSLHLYPLSSSLNVFSGLKMMEALWWFYCAIVLCDSCTQVKIDNHSIVISIVMEFDVKRETKFRSIIL